MGQVRGGQGSSAKAVLLLEGSFQILQGEGKIESIQ
jgi:hypothetical protein